MRRVVLCAAFLVGCAPSLDQLRSEPVLWSADFNQPYDTMTNCIAARVADTYTPTPQLYPQKRVGVVTLVYPGSGVFGEYTVRALESDRSQVEYKRRQLLANLGDADLKAKAAAERCGKT